METSLPAFELQPTLVGRVIMLRPLGAEDFDQLYAVASDPLIWDQHPFPKHEIDAFKDFFDLALQTKSAFAIVDKQTQKIIGTSRFYNLDVDKVWIGYTFLARSHWGGHTNRELKSLMLGHAFQFVSQVFFDIGETNRRSRRAVEKLGATFIRNQILKNVPYTLYVLDRATFSEGFQIRTY